jgi:hypothetical protein
MLSGANYLLFSTIEFSGLFVLTLSLFRMVILNHFKEIILSSFLCSALSLMLYNMNIHSVGIVVQIIAVVICFKYIYGIDFLRSIVIGIFGYGSFMLIQNLLVSILVINGIVNVDEFIPNTPFSHLIQTSTTILIYVISIAIKKTNQGFGYLIMIMLEKTKTSFLIVLVSGLAAILISASVFIFYLDRIVIFFLIILLSLIVATATMSYYFLKSDDRLYKFDSEEEVKNYV